MSDRLSWRQRLSRRYAIHAGIAMLAVYCFLIEPSWIEVREHHLATRLPVKIAQVSDVHLSPWNVTTDRIYSRLDEIKPDLIVLSGDIVDSPDDIEGPLQTFLQRLPVVKKVAILGNWEHWSRIPLDRLRKIYEEHGVQLLINQVELINGVQIVAFDDSTESSPDFALLKILVTGTPIVILEHSPGSFIEIADAIPRNIQAATILSGHTHGGQVSLFGYVPLTPPGSGGYISGWYGSSQGIRMYVSRGLGSSILNLRLGARPEIAVFQ